MSGIATGTAIAISAGLGVGGSVAGGLIGSHAAKSAADTQSAAANHAADLQYQASQNALGFQEQQYGQSQANLQPWLQSGAGGLANLDYLLGIGGQNWAQGAQSGQPGGTMGGAPTGGNPGGPMLPGASPGGGGYGTLPTNPRAMGVQGPMGSAQAGGMNPTTGQPFPPALGSANSSNLLGAFNPTAGQPGGMQGSAPGATGQPLPGGGANQGIGVPARPMGGAQPVSVQAPGGLRSVGSIVGPGGTPAQGPGGSVNPSLGGFGSLMAAYPGQFVAPTADEALNSPGEQAALKLGSQALDQSAAARGSVLTGGQGMAQQQYGQQLASTGYQNAYNNAFNTYSQNYNQYQQQQANEYNRLASLAGIGQTAAGQLGTLGQNSANSISSNLLNTASNIGQQYNNAGAANASGIVGAANAWGGAASGASSNINNLLLLNQLYGGGQGGGGGFDPGMGL